MKKYFAQLRPLERRLLVAVLVALFLVLNYVFIWPHFSDWGNLRNRMGDARRKLVLYRTTIAEKSKYEALVKKMEGEGGTVAPENQGINFLTTIRRQSMGSGVNIVSTSRQVARTNDFFVELTQNLTVIATDQQLVDFLYKLGSDASMIRVRTLELQPDRIHQHLDARLQLIASYQKTSAGDRSKKNTTVKPK